MKDSNFNLFYLPGKETDSLTIILNLNHFFLSRNEIEIWRWIIENDLQFSVEQSGTFLIFDNESSLNLFLLRWA